MTSLKIKIGAAAVVLAGAMATLALANSLHAASAARAAASRAATAHDIQPPPGHGNVACGQSVNADDCDKLEMLLPN